MKFRVTLVIEVPAPEPVPDLEQQIRDLIEDGNGEWPLRVLEFHADPAS